MKRILFLSLVLLAQNALADLLPTLPGQEGKSPHKLFVSSQAQPSDSFDTWMFDGGYAYTVFDTVDLFVGARIDSSATEEESDSGFLSGVSYQFSEKVSLQSTLHSKTETLDSGEKESVYSAEVSSRVKISDHFDLHATLDYEEWQQGIEVGLGFRF
ncbi:ribonuclease regulator [Vibrio sp. JC009]|uniref:ribonuclease regulator n=1 Tax=Vibrio sp. JC009 TaxID=2912314 RepID=UPI0023AED41C|nr:ribonuclease regulator [Vibrio sp. JC009]WED22338.1 ribonuclease regulator [Vibrio sp. JC009]